MLPVWQPDLTPFHQGVSVGQGPPSGAPGTQARWDCKRPELNRQRRQNPSFWHGRFLIRRRSALEDDRCDAMDFATSSGNGSKGCCRGVRDRSMRPLPIPNQTRLKQRCHDSEIIELNGVLRPIRPLAARGFRRNFTCVKPRARDRSPPIDDTAQSMNAAPIAAQPRPAPAQTAYRPRSTLC